MWPQVSLFLSQITRLTDRRTDGETDRQTDNFHVARPRCMQCIQRDKNCSEKCLWNFMQYM